MDRTDSTLSTTVKIDVDIDSEDNHVSSDAKEESDEDEIQKIFSDAYLTNYELIDELPPTPSGLRQPPRASSSASSVFSMRSTRSTPKKEGNAGESSSSDLSPSPKRKLVSSPSKKKVPKRVPKGKSAKEVCKDLGIDIGDSELGEMDDDEEEEERNPVDCVIEEILSRGLGKRKKQANAVKDENLADQFDKIGRNMPIEITPQGRLSVLKDDVETIRKQKEKIDALVKVLEITRIRLINDDPKLTFTEPLHKVRRKKDDLF